MTKGIIHDLDEGHTPYQPRYILPNYLVLIEKGSRYLELKPPRNMYEAVAALISMYNYVPSITSYPVYIGDVDVLLRKFVGTVSESELINLLTLYWRLIDRLLPDAFVHANLSPEDNEISRKILEIDRAVKQPVPNLTLKYDPERTSEELALLAVRNALQLSEPYLANDPLLRKDWPQGYGVASCYNVLPYGGGSYKLVRLNLYALLKEYGGDVDRILNEGIPLAVRCVADLVSARSTFIVEESGFFETSFLVNEGFIDPDNFTAMFRIYALAEAMDVIADNLGINEPYGHNEELNGIAVAIIRKIYEEAQRYDIKHLKASRGKIVLHSQAEAVTFISLV